MKKRSLAAALRSRFFWASIGGLMLAAGFPNGNVASLAWIAPGFILMTAIGQPGSQAFRLGYVAGLAFFLATLYWLLLIPFPVGAVAAWLSLSAYLALYPAVWVWLCWKLFPVSTGLAAAAYSDMHGKDLISSTTWLQRLVWALTAAALWTALEMIRARFLTGFPWNLLGVSQYRVLPLIQICSVTGIYGISFLMVWFSLSLASAFWMLWRRPTERWGWLGELILPLLALMGVLLFGFDRLEHAPVPTRTLNVTMVQPSIPQTLIWNPKESTNRFRSLIDLSRQALAHAKTDLLIWPEAAVPNILRYDPELTYPAITNLVETAKVWLILQADDAQPRSPNGRSNDYDLSNSSFLFSPDGQIRAIYHKQRLVIFGEYVPLSRWLPFLKWLTPIEGGFTPGTHPVPFHMPELKANTSVLICFEDVFPQSVREYVQPNTDFLVNLTNDGWFGQSAAQWQHAFNALFRAVENGLPLVRCANNGLTCWIDPLGRLHDVNFDNRSNIYQAGFKTAKVPLLPLGQLRQPTFYNRYGDCFGWACVALAAAALLWLVKGKLKPQDATHK
ncbi:MAG: apolipoprotein N-acyltransferase [Candidatus Omnitrophica bacterium]|nr:apolipoprotein N-acyltransferase [Candidatus Omnitrophota bacterium]